MGLEIIYSHLESTTYMRQWEYAAIIHVEFDLGNGTEYPDRLDTRWILTTSTSSSPFDYRNHPKLEKIQERFLKNRRMKEDDWADKNKKLVNQRKEELHRILEKCELPNSVIIGRAGEDALALIRTASEHGWETTGRTPDGNNMMMRRRIE